MDMFGFSWIGTLFLVALIVPNLLWMRAMPIGYSAAGENRALVAMERVGEALTSAAAVTCADLAPRPWDPGCWLLIAAVALMALYEIWWIRYFRSAHELRDFYAPMAFIPVPGAVLPVASFLLLGAYAASPWLIGSAILLGIGHIGVHLQHARAL